MFRRRDHVFVQGPTFVRVRVEPYVITGTMQP